MFIRAGFYGVKEHGNRTVSCTATVSELYPGRIIGFYISISDWDETGYEQGFYQYHNLVDVLTHFKYSDDFADGLLVGTGGVIPEDTAVENRSWGRIKASFSK